MAWHDTPNCGVYGGMYRKASTGDTRIQPHGCKQRGWCPYCAYEYGLGLGGSVFNSLETYIRGAFGSWVPGTLAFTPTFTLPEVVSLSLGSLVWDEDMKEHRKRLSDLTAALRVCLGELLGDGVGARLNWHWWHSDDPLGQAAMVVYGHPWHYHVYVQVPNVRVRDGNYDIIRERGKLSKDDLLRLRELWTKAVYDIPWVREIAPERQLLNVHWHFETAWEGLRHRCEYDYRHPLYDLCQWLDREKLLQPGAAVPDLNEFANLTRILQKERLARAFGSQSPRALSGVMEQVTGPDEWERVKGIMVYFERYDSEGVFVRMYDGWDYTNQYWPHDAVKLFGPQPKRYIWRSSA
jgi:hypothetical protein